MPKRADSAARAAAWGGVLALVGVWAPMFSAYEIAAVFLLPFVVIRLVAGDWQSGVLKLELQQPLTPLARTPRKAVSCLAGWLVTAVAGAAGILLWISYGGHYYAPEIFAVVAGASAECRIDDRICRRRGFDYGASIDGCHRHICIHGGDVGCAFCRCSAWRDLGPNILIHAGGDGCQFSTRSRSAEYRVDCG